MRMRVFLLFCLVTMLSACNVPSAILATETMIPEPTASPLSDWVLIEDGLEWRRLKPHGDELAQLIVVRINPKYFRFRAVYRAGDPQSLASWRELEPAASVIINANFFDRENRRPGHSRQRWRRPWRSLCRSWRDIPGSQKCAIGHRLPLTFTTD